ncbi:MAG: hypothetical protein V3W20_12775, partial [Candidatus Neomarinimicrobiota bacterium]
SRIGTRFTEIMSLRLCCWDQENEQNISSIKSLINRGSFMPWIKEEKFYLTVLLLLILIMAVRTPLDTDMWWHLRAGEETWSAQSVYLVDTISYTRAGEPWINHSWLAQVVMIGLYKLGEYKALSLWVGVTAAISMLFVYLQMEGHALIKTSLVLFASFVSSVVWSPRPQIFSFLLFAITGFIIFRFKTKGKNQLYWLAPIFIVWSNLHGGYVLGIILIISVIIGEIYNQTLGEESENSLNWSEIRRLAIWGTAGFVLAAVNPNGVKMWIIPFQTVGVTSLQNLISEWASPDFHQPIQQLMLVLLFGTFAAVGLSKRRLTGSELLSVAVFGILALTARRNFGPFALVATPVLSKHLASLLLEWNSHLTGQFKFFSNLTEYQNKSRQEINKTIQSIVNIVVVFILIFTAGYKWINVSNLEFVEKTEQKTFPVDAVNWIKKEKPEGNLLNEYNWGGYLAWQLREYQVFVDGRTDLFGDEIIGNWLDLINTVGNWEKSIDDWEINTIFLKRDRPIVQALVQNGWVYGYRDETVVVLLRNE